VRVVGGGGGGQQDTAAGPGHDVSVVVVNLNGLPWLERCLESVRGYETIVVDHGSRDSSLELVRRRFPQARVLEQANVGMGGGNNAGMRAASGRYFLLLNPDAWPVGDAVARLRAFADGHPEAAVVGPRLLNADGTLQRSVRAFPTRSRLATEYFFLRKLAPGSTVLNPLYVGGFDHRSVREVDWVSGACLLVRREATEAVGLFDERFFMFSEETDWCYRFRRAGWRVLFYPAAEVVHVGGATHGGALYRENLRGHLRFLAKHRGAAEAERTRRMLVQALRLRGALFRGERGQMYRDAARWLRSAPIDRLLESRE
jgi:N-acetylglucosaminyl-diphospho-decaprenol L-rhamnosyltransferase